MLEDAEPPPPPWEGSVADDLESRNTLPTYLIIQISSLKPSGRKYESQKIGDAWDVDVAAP